MLSRTYPVALQRIRPLVAIASLQRRRYTVSREAYNRTKRLSISSASRDDWWLAYAREKLDWDKVPEVALDSSNPPFYQWFPDGEINMSYQALDRHVHAGRGDKVAIAYDSVVGGPSRDITYHELKRQVEDMSAALRVECGIEKGDRVLINMPMIPEALVAMLACSRIGAIHSVVFGGFAAAELAVRIDDATPKCVIAASGGLEGLSKVVPYGPLIEAAFGIAKHKVGHLIFKRRPEVEAKGGALVPTVDHSQAKLHDWDALSKIGSACPPHEKAYVPCKSADPLYILYTSGTTGKPKGVLRDHTHPVALQFAMENFFKVGSDETWCCFSDIGWVVGHSFTVYGPLINGSTTVLFEGKPVGTPDASTYWEIVERHKITKCFTAPTALRAIRREDPKLELARQHDISSLTTIFVAGERADPGTVDGYAEALKVDVVDNWWQTETGWPISGMQLEGVGTKAGSCGLPLPGYDVKVLDDATGEEVTAPNTLGSIVIELPFPPGVMQSLWGNPGRYVETYFSKYGQKYYFSGDAGFIDEDGYVSVMSRIDDIINTAGHRLSTGQMEEVISGHPRVAECAVVGANDPIKGQVPVALLVLNAGVGQHEEDGDVVVAEVLARVRDTIGPVASFKSAAIVPGLPKTRSGKTLRQIVQKISNGEEYVLPGTIEDTAPVAHATAALAGLGYPYSA